MQTSLKIKVFNENKNSICQNKQFPSLRPSSSKYILKKKTYSFGKNPIENFENNNSQLQKL